MSPKKTHRSEYSEDVLVEKPAIELFRKLDWESVNVYYEKYGKDGTLGRETDQEVVLVRRLLPKLRELNPDVPPEAFPLAIEEMVRDRRTLSAERANQDVYKLLRDGAKVKVRTEEGGEAIETVRFIDWETSENNDFLLASQFWVSGDMYRRRCDLVGFVNGIPLLFVELKATHKRLEDAYNKNLTDYRDAIPHLFWYNAFVILSNGELGRVGSTTAGWEYFVEWKKINDEGEEGIVSLETIVRGTCEPGRLLDLVANFVVFEEAQSGLVKKLAKNHQYLGVNRAIGAVRQIRENQGRLGVFWHTQGSGKSLSMIFFAQKILRIVPGNWTFVVVTDRKELDKQIYKQFVACGAITEKEAHAEDSKHLKLLLSEDHRYVFTLIQKFRTKKGERYPPVSDRSDIIVITDEAHRSQYDLFALNMRTALPNAAFIGFTGTPLMVGEEKTREIFGEYVSIYDYKQSVDDEATVPLYYENRIPELQLTNQDLTDDIYGVIEDADLDEDQERKLEREFAREYHLITREDRLEKVAADIVHHFVGRGYLGKAMVVSVDKATAVRMYDKVLKYWKSYKDELASKVHSGPVDGREEAMSTLAFMTETDMAVVVSSGQNEVKEMREKGLDIKPHRERMVKEDLDLKFKDPEDPLRLVFVCAMWMTGFDVPTCSTIYLDKPMRNHTLMQTIARANRVAKDKVDGLIVDYVGVFRNLQKALAIYAAPRPGAGTGSPIRDKAELVGLLKKAIGEAQTFCTERGVGLEAIIAEKGFGKIHLLRQARDLLVDRKAREVLDDSVEKVILNDDFKRQYFQLAGNVKRLYRAILPDPAGADLAPTCALIEILADQIRALLPPPDISAVMGAVESLLDESVAAEGYVIRQRPSGFGRVDLSSIDFDKLRDTFAKGRKRTEAEKLRGLITRKLQHMVALNHQRTNYVEKFQELIDEYNAGSLNTEQFFDELLKFAQALSEEEKRGLSEDLTEEELALFDILTKPDPALTKKEQADVKKIARGLLKKLKDQKLVLDWRKRQQARQAVRLQIEYELEGLPPAYSNDLYQLKCELAYRHVYDSYFGEGKSLYADALAS